MTNLQTLHDRVNAVVSIYLLMAHKSMTVNIYTMTMTIHQL